MIYSIIDKRTYNISYNLLKQLPLSYENGYGENASNWFWRLFERPLSTKIEDVEINSYCVPKNKYIDLYYYDIDGQSYILNITHESYIDQVKKLEQRRNSYIEYKKSRGRVVKEPKIEGRFFDLYKNKYIELGFIKYIEAEVNNDISKGLSQLLNEKAYISIEEFNYKYINFINNNIDKLSVLGFYGSNFPDIILFDGDRGNTEDYDLKKDEYSYNGDIHKWPIVGYKVYPIIDEKFIEKDEKRERKREKISGIVDKVIPSGRNGKIAVIIILLILLFIFREYIIGIGLLLLILFLIYKALR